VQVPAASGEQARAVFVELAPQGFEESQDDDGNLVLSLYADEAAAARLRTEFPAAAVTVEEVAPGWEHRWREFHHGVVVGPLWVGPPWETPPGDRVAVVVDPGRAFGTGAHPSTRLCLALLAEQERGSLLDVGCGSGVLSVAAVRLGFAPVAAVDVDPTAIEETLRNARTNGVEVEARVADGLTEELPVAELAVANIALGAARELLPRLRCRRAITAGYLAGDVVDARGYARVATHELEGWRADVFEPVEGA
jgi:ribosomal protein L11 methyltransferase